VPDSPLWFRGLAERGNSEHDVDAILADLGARAIVVGHTYNPGGGSSPIMPDLSSISRYHGKVYVIDTGISRVYHGVPTALLISGDDFTLWESQEEMPADSPATIPQEEPPGSEGNIESFLKAAPILKIRKTSLPGRTEPWKITLEDGGSKRQAIFKYIDRPRPNLIPDSWKYERAAYLICRYLSLTYVPPVVERQVEEIPGSLQLFVDGAIPEADRKQKHIEPPDPRGFEEALMELRVFANIVYDSCHNDEDTLIQMDTWRVYRVDFAQAFEPKKGLVRDCAIERCSSRLYGHLRAWKDDQVAKLLAPYLNQEEIQALNARVGLIIYTIRRLIQTRGEGAVLF
jgi:hypothetical protein